MYLQLDVKIAYIGKSLIDTVERSVDDSLWMAREITWKSVHAGVSNVMVARDTSTKGRSRVISRSWGITLHTIRRNSTGSGSRAGRGVDGSIISVGGIVMGRRLSRQRSRERSLQGRQSSKVGSRCSRRRLFLNSLIINRNDSRNGVGTTTGGCGDGALLLFMNHLNVVGDNGLCVSTRARTHR